MFCMECETKRASRTCVECRDNYCAKCFTEKHRKGNIKPFLLAVPISDFFCFVLFHSYLFFHFFYFIPFSVLSFDFFFSSSIPLHILFPSHHQLLGPHSTPPHSTLSPLSVKAYIPPTSGFPSPLNTVKAHPSVMRS
jgi:B-box zinc finger